MFASIIIYYHPTTPTASEASESVSGSEKRAVEDLNCGNFKFSEGFEYFESGKLRKLKTVSLLTLTHTQKPTSGNGGNVAPHATYVESVWLVPASLWPSGSQALWAGWKKGYWLTICINV